MLKILSSKHERTLPKSGYLKFSKYVARCLLVIRKMLIKILTWHYPDFNLKSLIPKESGRTEWKRQIDANTEMKECKNYLIKNLKSVIIKNLNQQLYGQRREAWVPGAEGSQWGSQGKKGLLLHELSCIRPLV